MSGRLKQQLDGYNADTLMSIAVGCGLIERGGRKPKKSELLELLAAKLGMAPRVKSSLSQLDDVARAVLAHLQRQGGREPTRRLARQLLRIGLVEEDDEEQHSTSYGYSYRRRQSDGDPNKTQSTHFADVIARLTLHGFVFAEQSDANGYNYKLKFDTGDVLFIPPEVAAHLPEPEPQTTVKAQWTPESTVQEDPALYLRDLYLYWDFVWRQSLMLTQQGYVRKNTLKVLNRSLLQPDPNLASYKNESESSRLYLLRQQLELLELIFLSGNELVATRGDEIHPFWMADQDTQIALLLVAWIKSEEETISDQTLDYYSDWTYARTTLIGFLSQLRVGVWTEINDIMDLVLSADGSFLFSDRDRIIKEYYRYYGRYGYDDFVDRIEAEALHFVSQAGAFPLVQLGLIELGYADDVNSEWRALRLTERGERILASLRAEAKDRPQHLREEGPADIHNGQVIVQPNFHILAMGPVSLATLAQLDTCAERQKVDVTVFEYRLTRDSVYRAQQQGMTATDIASFLAETSRMPLPQNVRRSLDEWNARHQRITIRTGVTLLQTLNEKELTTLMALPALKDDLTLTPVPTIAFVAHEQRRRVGDQLLKQGILPAYDDGKPASANGDVQFHADGTVEPIHALSSLQLTGRLNRLAEQDGKGGWRITAASIRRAGSGRQRIDEILKEMAKLHRGNLPGDLVAQVKRWGGYFGEVAVDTLTLVEFSDTKTLRELLKDKRMKAILHPFKAGDRALATIAADDRETLDELLLEQGIGVKQGIGR